MRRHRSFFWPAVRDAQAVEVNSGACTVTVDTNVPAN